MESARSARRRRFVPSPRKSGVQKRKASPRDGNSSDDTRKSKIANVSPSKSITDYYSPVKGSSSETAFGDGQDEAVIDVADYLEMDLGVCGGEEEEEEETTTTREYGYLYGRSLQRIIRHESEHQDALESNELKNGRKFNSLFSRHESECFQKFRSLPVPAVILYARMLCRKKSWHRVSSIKYSDVGDNVMDVFEILQGNGFVDVNIEDEAMEVQLGLLNKSELQKLCKELRIKVGDRKGDHVRAIIKNCKTQKSIAEFFKNANAPSRPGLCRKRIVEMLGTCVKLNEAALSAFNRLLLLFSLYQYPVDWRPSIQMMIEVSRCESMHLRLFPEYELNPTVIFRCRDDLILYEKAVNLMYDMDEAIEKRNNEKFVLHGREALSEFKKLMNDVEFKERSEALPSFLRKYSAGYVYASILTRYCENFKKTSSASEIIDVTKVLIANRNAFPTRKKGIWYRDLSMAYKRSGRIEDAARTLVEGLRDESVGDVQRLELQAMASALLKKKTNPLEEQEVRSTLSELASAAIASEPIDVFINATLVDGNKPGYKSVYVEHSENEIVWSSVEEHAIRYYKRNGYAEGIHDEGYIVHAIFGLIFFDVIYGPSPPGAFQSPYQERPLDLTSRSFYASRKAAIDRRLQELASWSVESIAQHVTEVYNQKCSLRCVVSWRDKFDPDLFADIVKCIGSPRLASICERFVRKYGEARSGFPDLTVWNRDTRQCKFVEVKSARDRLSPQQRIWLDFLRGIGLDCEVCHVLPAS